MNNLNLAPKSDETAVDLGEEVDQYSPSWASISKPFALIIFSLAIIVIVTPFVLLPWIQGLAAKDKAAMLIDWSKAVLPSVVGFASAVIGYYFGTRRAD
jgi:hypothetical protein